MGSAPRPGPAVSRLKPVNWIGGAARVMSGLQEIVRRLGETDCDMPDAWRDPLSHPAIRAMSAREIADLPFAAGYGRRLGR